MEVRGEKLASWTECDGPFTDEEMIIALGATHDARQPTNLVATGQTIVNLPEVRILLKWKHPRHPNYSNSVLQYRKKGSEDGWSDVGTFPRDADATTTRSIQREQTTVTYLFRVVAPNERYRESDEVHTSNTEEVEIEALAQ